MASSRSAGPDGTLEHWATDPYFQLSAFTDRHLTPSLFLRIGGFVSEAVDSLGPFGERQILQVRGHAYLKVGRFLYTGPEFLYTNPERVAVPATQTYGPAIPEYSLTWLIGGAVNPG